MSAETQPGELPADETVYEEATKDATIFAYSEGDYEDTRAFLEAVFGDGVDIDVNAMTEHESVEVDLRVNFEGVYDTDTGWTKEVDERVNMFGTQEKAAINFFQRDDVEVPEWVTFEHETTVEEEFDHTPTKIIRSYFDDVFADDVLSEYGFRRPGWADYMVYGIRDVLADNGEKHEQKTKLRVSTTQRRRELKPREERIEDNSEPYATDEEFWSVKFNLLVTGNDVAETEEISEKLLPVIKDRLLEIGEIDSVRHEECIENTCETGACLAI